jgi:hypothetical protein
VAHVCFFEMSRSRCRPLKRTRFIGSYSRHFRAGLPHAAAWRLVPGSGVHHEATFIGRFLCGKWDIYAWFVAGCETFMPVRT